MSAEVLREAAAAIRKDCPIPERSREYDFIDFPSGWAIQRAGVEHVAQCSTTQTGGAMLCDCEAIYPSWRRWRTLLAVADWLDRVVGLYPANPYDDRFPGSETARALAVARAYLGSAS